ncbi:MAG: hypothetical protein DRG87_00160 [Deltaproteobacteria bacterium]|nr:DUF2219 family protein [Deltaproteobacteria bacterium]MBW2076936.1 DUF2219 family protein [Deltaproteobacteria bacterium]MBW2310637.1 DUF2219 family protein [Deltaproteobacteria bacterium]RLB32226.1 MAG: hypothetical protein DRG87_00160 [Deltaproteobacteria bacterium]
MMTARCIALLILISVMPFSAMAEVDNRVDKEPFTADIMAGFSFIFSRFKMSYVYVYRTKELENQQKANIFGTITVSFTY